jgi:hypothetical protein
MALSFLPLLALALGAGPGDDLQIVNPRATYGYLGAPRPKGAGILPGDVAHVTFGVKGLQSDAHGRASLGIGIEIKDDAGKLVFQQKPYNAVAQDNFGGDTLPCAAHVEIPLDTKPGTVHWTVTVEDRVAKKQTTLKGEGKVLPPDFGLVRVGTFADPEGKIPVPAVNVVGATVFVGFSATGFARAKDGKPDLHVELRVLDDKGQPTSKTPLSGDVKADVPEGLLLLPMQFGLTLTRPGTFTVELSARDQTSGKTATVSLPIRVVDGGGLRHE